MKPQFTTEEIEKQITKLYLAVKSGEVYEDKAFKEAYLLNSILKAKDIDLKTKEMIEVSEQLSGLKTGASQGQFGGCLP